MYMIHLKQNVSSVVKYLWQIVQCTYLCDYREESGNLEFNCSLLDRNVKYRTQEITETAKSESIKERHLKNCLGQHSTQTIGLLTAQTQNIVFKENIIRY